jgi:hypothetical protein
MGRTARDKDFKEVEEFEVEAVAAGIYIEV